MADDKQERIETLQDRVDELEATVSKMLPSRRDALKLGAAGAVGAVGMAGSASAQNSNQVGTIGTDSDRVDVNAEDIDAVSVNTESASITNLPSSAGADKNYLNFDELGTDHIETASVGTSATVIATREAPSGRTGSMTMVTGESPSGEGFTSVVHWTQRGNGYTLISDIDTNGLPSSRSYSTDNFEGLKLSMSADTYEVYTRTIELGHDKF